MSTPAMSAADRRRLVIAGAIGAGLAAAALWAGDGLTDRATAQGAGGIELSATQLRINQRISQAAVRRSNESLQLLDPIRPAIAQPAKVLGWRTGDLRDGAVTTPKVEDGAISTPKIADGSVTRSKLAPDERFRWVTKTTNGPELTARASDPSFVLTREFAGNYRADFARPVTSCSFTATPTVDGPGLPQAVYVKAAVDTTDTDRVVVHTFDATGTHVESGFTVQLMC